MTEGGVLEHEGIGRERLEQSGGETTPDSCAPHRKLAAGPWRILAAAARAAANIIVPPACVACQAPLVAHDSLCAACWRDIIFIRDPVCDRLGVPLPAVSGERQVSAAAIADPPIYDRARAVAIFGGPMQKLIHGFKYSDRHDARRLFGRWLMLAGAPLVREADVIVPVPLNRWRLIERRYNQAAILGNEVARLSGVAIAPLALERIKTTTSQVGLSTIERRTNVAGAFLVPARRRNEIEGRRVLLVDDVITTGATLDSAARALKKGGAKSVDALALAIVTHPVS